MANETVKRILHAKDSVAKAAFFHNEIINRLEKGVKVTVVNMPEFEVMGDAGITCKNVDDISVICQDRRDEHSKKSTDSFGGQAVFVFEIYPNTTLIETLGKLGCEEINVTVPDFSSTFTELFERNGFETLYISDDYISAHVSYGSVEELSAAVLGAVS